MTGNFRRVFEDGAAAAFMEQWSGLVRARHAVEIALCDADGAMIWPVDGAASAKHAGAPNALTAPVSLDRGVVAALVAIPSANEIAPADMAPLKSLLETNARALTEWMSARDNVSKFTEELEGVYEELTLIYSLSESLDISKTQRKPTDVICEAVTEILRGDLVILQIPSRRYEKAYPANQVIDPSLRALTQILAAREEQHTLTLNDFPRDPELASYAGGFAHVAMTGFDIDKEPCFLFLFRRSPEDRFFMADVKLLETVARQASISLTNQKIMASRRQLFDASIFGLARLAESRDTDTGEHLERMRDHCRLLADSLCAEGEHEEITGDFLADIYRSCPLHDIGKVGIPDRILLKPGKLTRDEFETMKAHTIIGGDTLRDIERRLSLGGDTFLTLGRQIAYCHHEKWDGSGYPQGIAGKRIPLAARIVAVADVYDALTNKRCYKDAMPSEEARSVIVQGSGGHFDPAVVDAFERTEQEFLEVRSHGENTAACDKWESWHA